MVKTEETELNSLAFLTEMGYTCVPDGAPRISGWIARDSIEDAFMGCGLILHHTKPHRDRGEWSSQTIAMHLPSNMFPELRWEDEPVEVELIIAKKKNS